MSITRKFLITFALMFSLSLASCQDNSQADLPDKTEIKLEPVQTPNTEASLSHEDLIGQWDIIRFDTFTPTYRLNGEGKRSAYVDFFESQLSTGSLQTNLHIGCNFSGNSLHLIQKNSLYELSHIPRPLDRVATERGCEKTSHQRDQDFFSMMYESPKIEQRGKNRLHLQTDVHELILEKSTIGQTRNAIHNFEALIGTWSIVTANQGGFGLGGAFFVPEPIVISKAKIQYGDNTSYLKSPQIGEGGKIRGNVIDGVDALICAENKFLPIDTPRIKDTTALCFVLNTITQAPIADPLYSPDNIQLSSGEYRLVLQRMKE